MSEFYSPEDIEQAFYDRPLEVTAAIVQDAAQQAAEQAAAGVQAIKFDSAARRESEAMWAEAEQNVLKTVNRADYERAVPRMREILPDLVTPAASQDIDKLTQAVRAAYEIGRQQSDTDYWNEVAASDGTKAWK
jgi:hypothetical protein